MRIIGMLGLAMTVAAAGIAGAQEAVAVGETFDKPPAGWQLEDEGDRGAAVRDGALVVWVDNSARQYQSMTVHVPGEYRDASVEVEVQKRSGAPSTAIGLLCRHGAAGRYFADLDEKGEIRIGANLKGEGQKVLAKAEKPGAWRDGVNRLRLECVAGNLAFSVNGVQLLTATDARLTAGSVGLRAGGAGSERTEAAFDNLVVTPR
jgi:hypothetical protein